MENRENKQKPTKPARSPMRELLYHYLYPSCAFFTVALFITNLVGTAAKKAEIVPTLSFMGLLYVFCLFLAAMNRIFATKLNGIIKLAIHFVACVTAFALVFVVFTGYYRNGSSAVFIVCFFIFAYLLVMAAVVIVRSLLQRRKNDSEPYRRQF